MRASYLGCLLVAAATVAAGLVAACSSPQTPASAPRTLPLGAPATVSPAPATTTGLIPAPRGLTDRLVLRQARVTAGTPIKGTLIVTYRGRAPINLTRRCSPQYAVVVTNHRFPPEAAFASSCSLLPFMMKPGENRLPVTVLTTYLGCSEVRKQATSSTPACLRGRQKMPPLPPGRYEAVLVGDGQLPLPAPVPVPVLLVPAR
jgi:hypothetical protein